MRRVALPPGSCRDSRSLRVGHRDGGPVGFGLTMPRSRVRTGAGGWYRMVRGRRLIRGRRGDGGRLRGIRECCRGSDYLGRGLNGRLWCNVSRCACWPQNAGRRNSRLHDRCGGNDRRGRRDGNGRGWCERSRNGRRLRRQWDVGRGLGGYGKGVTEDDDSDCHEHRDTHTPTPAEPTWVRRVRSAASHDRAIIRTEIPGAVFSQVLPTP